jgi:hypothetical protein
MVDPRSEMRKKRSKADVGCFDVVVFTKAPEIEAGERQCSGPESRAARPALSADDRVLRRDGARAYPVGLLGHPSGRTSSHHEEAS